MGLMATVVVIVTATADAPAPAQRLGSTMVTAVKTHTRPLKFSAPSLGLTGEISPGPGRTLLSVEVTVGTKVMGDIAAFRLMDSSENEHSPIGVGVERGDMTGAVLSKIAASDTILPLDRLQVGAYLITGLASGEGAVVVARKTKEAVTIDSPPTGVIALLYEIPPDASPKAVKLPDGTLLPMKK